MCTTVQFVYRCGCSESTTFQCLGTVNYHSRRRRQCRLYHSTVTVLDEECHDCSRERDRTCDMNSLSSSPPVAVLRERPLNLPTKSPPTVMLHFDIAPSESQLGF
ncbi:hypothetical protein GGR54DRAFT_645577 [Hypoxylon sp. NC1633]|nr:hypothetical protein GGR54DRAFT_645577 [Hypoxylon sp. NC1633]